MAEHKFNPNEHLIQIKNRGGSADYLTVQWRLVWFREKYPNGTIDTEELEVDLDRETEEETYQWNNETRRSEKVIKRARGYARFKATATNGEGGRATGTKSEKAASFADYIEKAETGAIGRALAGLGFGTQFTGDEFDEQHRIVDAPVQSNQTERNSQSAASNRPAKASQPAPSTSPAGASLPPQPAADPLEKKRAVALKYAERLQLNKPPVETMDEISLDDKISQYKMEYQQRQQSAKAETEARAALATER